MTQGRPIKRLKQLLRLPTHDHEYRPMTVTVEGGANDTAPLRMIYCRDCGDRAYLVTESERQ